MESETAQEEAVTPRTPVVAAQTVAGHASNFCRCETSGRLLKVSCLEEQRVYEDMTRTDSLPGLRPAYYGTVELEKDEEGAVIHMQLSDLTAGFDTKTLAVADIKMGRITFNPATADDTKPRPDLFNKLKLVNGGLESLCPGLQAAKAVTKRCYMGARDRSSTSASLGFRLDGLKPAHMDKPFTKGDLVNIDSQEKVQHSLGQFFEGRESVLDATVKCLHEMEKQLRDDSFFCSHALYGSSLLVMHDANGGAGVFMIDFANTVAMEAPVSHMSESMEEACRTGDDGYLSGLINLRSQLECILTRGKKARGKRPSPALEPSREPLDGGQLRSNKQRTT